LRGEHAIEDVMRERHSLLVAGAVVQRIGETFGRNDMRMFLADGTKLGCGRVVFEAFGSIAADDRELRLQVEEYGCKPFKLKRSRVVAALTQHVDYLAVEPDSPMRMARASLREHVLEETLCARRIEGVAFHDLGQGYLGVDKQNAIRGVEGRTVPAGGKVIGDGLERTGSGHQDERVARARTLGEVFRNRMMDKRLAVVELNGVTSGVGPCVGHGRVIVPSRSILAASWSHCAANRL